MRLTSNTVFKNVCARSVVVYFRRSETSSRMIPVETFITLEDILKNDFLFHNLYISKGRYESKCISCEIRISFQYKNGNVYTLLIKRTRKLNNGIVCLFFMSAVITKFRTSRHIGSTKIWCVFSKMKTMLYISVGSGKIVHCQSLCKVANYCGQSG